MFFSKHIFIMEQTIAQQKGSVSSLIGELALLNPAA